MAAEKITSTRALREVENSVLEGSSGGGRDVEEP